MTRITYIAGLFAIGAIACFPGSAAAAVCKATVESNDAMQFTTKVITVPRSCRQFAVTLKHVGKLPVAVMGHNLVIARTADLVGVASEGMKAGAAANYVKAGDARVLAASKLVGGGQSSTFAIPVGTLEAGESYSYVCTFPGHSSIMRGTLSVK